MKLSWLNKAVYTKKIDFTGYKFKQQEYIAEMRCDDARTFFKLRSCMLPTVQMNFMSNPEFTKNLWTCLGCMDSKDSQSHIMSCPGYLHLRTNKDLNHDPDLVKYFQEVIRLRQEMSL